MFELIDKPTALALIALLPCIGFVLNAFYGKRLDARSSGLLASAAIFGAFVLALGLALELFLGNESSETFVSSKLFSWIPIEGWADLSFSFRFDRLSALMVLVITGVGTLIHLYSIGYMGHDKSYWRYFAYLNLFCFSMLCLVLGDNLLVMFLGWEGVGLCSYLLIGFWFNDIEKSKAGKKAFIANRIGDLGFLLGIFLLGWHFHSLSYADILNPDNTLLQAANGPLFTAACISFFVGATGKSAQIPLYVWLPDAMAGPTPVSALIHAATMVTAGVYMICRLSPIFELAPLALEIIGYIGGLTALFAASIALVQRDIKKVLAYSTVSQLGFMFIACGMGAYNYAMFHLITHAFFKALLFLGAGSVIHALEHGYGHGNPDAQDMGHMGGLKTKMPLTHLSMMAGGLALAGIFPFAGFFSKDEILLSALKGNTLIYALGLIAAAMTAFYTARMLAMTFYGSFRGESQVWEKCHESPRIMTAPLIILAIFALGAGFINLPHAFTTKAAFLSDFLEESFEPAKRIAWERDSFEELDYESRKAIESNSLEGREHLAQIKTEAALAFSTPTFSDTEAASNHSSEAAEVHSHAGHGQEWMNMIISLAVALIMFGFGFRFYKRGDLKARLDKGVKPALQPLFKLLSNKYYVDEIYEKLIIRPTRMIAQLFFVFIDMFLIDALFVNGAAFSVGAFGYMARRIQSGLLTRYLFFFIMGVLFILLYFLW